MLKVSHYISMKVSTSQDQHYRSPQLRDLELFAEGLFAAECSNGAFRDKGQPCMMSNSSERRKRRIS
jgi:hypothetical protein